jgi:transcriptional regulator with XRE-family HTH domain
MKPLARTPLAELVHARLTDLDLRQSDFCRENDFDQGLLSKIMSSHVNSLSLESILRLAAGLGVPAKIIIDLLERADLYRLLVNWAVTEYGASPVNSVVLKQEAPRPKRRKRGLDTVEVETGN